MKQEGTSQIPKKDATRIIRGLLGEIVETYARKARHLIAAGLAVPASKKEIAEYKSKSA